MDIVCNIWGALLWLLVGGVCGWVINTIINGSKITELKNSIMDRDSRLMAISRDHKSIIGEQEKKNLALKGSLSHLERANTEVKSHNIDLRRTIDELRKTQEEHLSLLFEPPHTETIEKTQEVETSGVTIEDNEIALPASTVVTPKKKNRKLKNAKRKLKKALKQNTQLRNQIKKLKLTIKKGPKVKTIIKELPVIIREEVQIKESIDKNKLEKLFGFKVPILKSRKTIRLSKKKGKPTIVKK